MSAKITEAQMWSLLEGIAAGRPLGALAGLAGVSTPTLTNKLADPAFLGELVGLFDVYDDATAGWLEFFEYWWNRPGERSTSYQLRQRVAKLIREKFHAEDMAEQEEGRRRGWLKRGGVTWTWDRFQKCWTCGGSWWRGSIGG